MPSIHEALSSVTSAPHKPGMEAPSCNLGPWERWRQETRKFNGKFNNATVYTESEARQGCKR